MSEFDDLIRTSYSTFQTPRYRVSTALKFARLYLKGLNLISPGRAGETSSKWFFSPIRSKQSPRDEAMTKRAQVQKTLSLPTGVEFVSYSWGDGDKRVVLAHGWESKAVHFRVFIDALLDAGFQVIAFDAPGHGLANGAQSDIVEFRDILFALEVEYGAFYGAVGHSLGGLALANALKIGLAVDRAVIISAPASFPGVIYKYAKILTLPESLHQSLRESVKRHFATDDSIWDRFTSYKDVDDVSTQTLVIHDEDDQEVLLVESECLAQSLPNASLVKTQGLGHKKIIKSDEVVGHILTHLA